MIENEFEDEVQPIRKEVQDIFDFRIKKNNDMDTKAIIFYGSLVCKSPRRHAKLTGISAPKGGGYGFPFIVIT